MNNQKAFDHVAYNTKPLEYPTFEGNGDAIKIMRRKQQLKRVRNILFSPSTDPKTEVIVISSTRGMGKTFFLKKLAITPAGKLHDARRVGRIVTIKCTKLSPELMPDKRYAQFWQRVIVHHMLTLFRGSTVSNLQFPDSLLGPGLICDISNQLALPTKYAYTWRYVVSNFIILVLLVWTGGSTKLHEQRLLLLLQS